MTTLVQGVVNQAALAPLGKRIIVRELSPGVSMVDVADVPSAVVTQILRDAGADVLDKAPAPDGAPATIAATFEATTPRPIATFAPPTPPACFAAPCHAQPAAPWWERWSPAMAAGGVALLFELVAHLH